jgi:hypothetical protein
LCGAVTTHDDHPGPSRGRRRVAALLLAGALVGASCSGDDGAADADDPAPSDDAGPNAGALPTLAGGLELAAVEPVRVLSGDGLAYGQPLPSQQAAADAFLEEPEVAAVTARRIHSLLDGRLVGDALVLELDGRELFDQSVLDAFVRGAAGALGGEEQEEVDLGGRTVIRSEGSAGTTIAYIEGNLLTLVRGPDAHDVQVVVERQLAALAAGVAGARDPRTPLVPLALDAAFVRVPTVTFEPIPPPEEEPAPEPPALAGATGVQGRYGVVAGERRTTVWAFTVDPQTYPWAEALDEGMADLASSRTGGASAEAVEVHDRVVQRSDGSDEVPSARVFRHQGLVLLVEGPDPEQVDAVVSAWIAALAAP